MEDQFIQNFQIRTWLEPICIIYILCSVLFVFYISLMLQIISEIIQVWTRLEPIQIIYILCNVLFTFHIPLMLQIISEINLDCKNKWSLNYFLFILSDTDLVRTNMHHLYIMQCHVYVLFLTYVANTFLKIPKLKMNRR